MPHFKKSLLLTLSLFAIFSQTAHAAGEFIGKVNADGINLRSDSNTTSKIICTINKGTLVKVVLEKYEWYKIALPNSAPAYVKRSFFEAIKEFSGQDLTVRTAKAIKDNINVRLSASESSVILGKVRANEIVKVTADKAGWYRIEPTAECFGWINKKFIEATSLPAEPEPVKIIAPAQKIQENTVEIEGTIQPYGKVVKRIATHKLITKNFEIMLLKGNPDNLNDLLYHKVRITAKPIGLKKDKYPTFEIIKMEALN